MAQAIGADCSSGCGHNGIQRLDTVEQHDDPSAVKATVPEGCSSPSGLAGVAIGSGV